MNRTVTPYALRPAAPTPRSRGSPPGAALIVVGQSWIGNRQPRTVAGLSVALRSATTAVGVEFVDPLTDKWFLNDTGKLVGSDGVHLTDDGHKYLAEQLQPRIAAALGRGIRRAPVFDDGGLAVAEAE